MKLLLTIFLPKFSLFELARKIHGRKIEKDVADANSCGPWPLRNIPVPIFDRDTALPRLAATLFVMCLVAGCHQQSNQTVLPPSDGASTEATTSPVQSESVAGEATIQRLVGSEEFILALTPRLKLLDKSVLNLALPDHNSRALFAADLIATDLVSAGPETVDQSPLAIRFESWAVDEVPVSVKADHASWWRPLFSDTAFFEHAKFYFVRGRFPTSDFDRFESRIGFTGLLRRMGGSWRSVHGELDVVWELASGQEPANAESWRVRQWKLLELSTHERHKALFSDQLVSAIPDKLARERAQTSKHWQYALRHYYPRKRARLPGGYSDERYFVVSTAHHPGLAVVDIDRDGYDDLYVTVRWGKNMLWRNRGDGSFEEIAGSVGLDIDGRSNAAVFADFDNDGDADVFIGRSLDRSLYLMNEQGRFVDRSASHVFHPLPMEVSSVSAADYNGDGLLDIYFSTYHQEDVSRRVDADLGNTLHRIHKTLTPTQSLDLSHRYREENEPYVNQVGPPNLLLVNHGAGRFDKSPENDQVMIWRNSFQATWSDYDQDGDADLYVANDFAPDCLLRNDGRGGFADVTQETGMHELGFGMGASWGDYDNDGDQDLYVSNMFSKAGMRITRQIIGLNPRIADLAQGNYLFRNEGKGNGKGDGNRFQRVSGLSPPALTVARAGWSWGGQFADFDNDGFLDLYVSSGYYSVPKDFETNVDL